MLSSIRILQLLLPAVVVYYAFSKFVKNKYDYPTAEQVNGCSAAVGKNKRWIYAQPFVGEPKESNFQLKEEDIPPLQTGDVLFEALYLSVDPYMRMYEKKIGDTMIGTQVARVVESKHDDFKVGTHVVGQFGWQLYTVGNPDTLKGIDGQPAKPSKLPDFRGLPLSLALGVLGMPGNTAYFGLLELCQPKAGEVVVVSGAAGAVGSIVGQIAKIKECKVIGIAGSDEKLKWLKNKLNFDGVINYKNQDVSEELKNLAPNGVDCYFDNVGGEISSQVLYQMNKNGRIAVCGSISNYNSDLSRMDKATVVQVAMARNELRMEGFTVRWWLSRWKEGIEHNIQWINEGKLKYRETTTDGFENMPEAFIGMLKGDNIGKAVVKV